MKTILGLDISSSCSGYAIIDINDKTLIAYGHIKVLKKDKYSIVERLDHLAKEINSLCFKYNPEIIVIEEISKFMAHRSSANTMITLGIFNRVCALEVYKTTNKIPIFLMPITIRTAIKKHIGLKEKIKKEEMPNIIKNHLYDAFDIKMKKDGKTIDSKVFDEADAVAAAWAGLIKLNG